MQLQKLTKLPTNAKVGVVGGGVSGLFFTYFLGKLRPDVHITLMDPNHGRAGGWINSWNTTDKNGKGIMLERGPRTLRGVSDGTVLMIDTLKQQGQIDKVKCIEKTAEANKKFLVDSDNHLVQVPDSWNSFRKFLSSPISKGLTSSILFEWARAPKKGDADESVAQLIKRRFGKSNLGDNIMSAIYHGIYADDVATLSAKTVSANLFNDEQKYGSSLKATLAKWWKQIGSKGFDSPKLSPVLQQYQANFGRNSDEILRLSKKLKEFPMLSFNGGLSVVPNTVANALKGMPNVSIVDAKATRLTFTNNKLQLEVSSENNVTKKDFDHVRFSITPNYIQNIITKQENSLLNSKLEQIKYNTVLLVNFYLPGKDVITNKHHSFGYLVPKANANPEKILGVIFDSVIEQSAKPLSEKISATTSTVKQNYTKLTAMIGGHLLNDASGSPVIPDEKTTIFLVKKALRKHLNISSEDLEAGLWVYTVAKDCLPRFSVGYLDLADSIEKEVLKDYNGQVSFGGMGFSGGPGVPNVVTDSMLDAIKLK